MPSVIEKAYLFSQQAKANSQRNSLHRYHQTTIKPKRPRRYWTFHLLRIFSSNKGYSKPGMPKEPISRPETPVELVPGEPETANVPSQPSASSGPKREDPDSALRSPKAKAKNLTTPSDIDTDSVTASKLAYTKGAIDEEHSPCETGSSFINQTLTRHARLRKKEFLEKLMAIVRECLDKGLEPLEEQCDGEGCSSQSHGSSSASAPAATKPNAAGKKRQHGKGRDNSNESDNEEDRNRGKGVKRAKTERPKEPQPRYACPYLKYAPERYSKVKTCCGPGWDQIHRVKEHLSRCHKLPEFQCPRCFERFKKKQDCLEHQRAASPCKVKDIKSFPRDLADGFDQEQYDKLEKRSTKPGHEKWASMYCILFEKTASEVPSPWYGVESMDNWRKGHTDRSLHQPAVDMLWERIPPILHSWLSDEWDRDVGPSEHKLLMSLSSKVPVVMKQVLDSCFAPQFSAAYNQEAVTCGYGTDLLADPLSALADLEGQLGVHDSFNFEDLEPEGGSSDHGSDSSIIPEETLSSSVSSLDSDDKNVGFEQHDGDGGLAAPPVYSAGDLYPVDYTLNLNGW